MFEKRKSWTRLFDSGIRNIVANVSLKSEVEEFSKLVLLLVHDDGNGLSGSDDTADIVLSR